MGAVMICLNVASHDIQLKGFTNIDLDESMKPDLVYDCTKLTEKFAVDTVDFIYCAHFLEHLTLVQAQSVVNDFYKLLRPYSMCAIVVPDYTKILDLTPITEVEKVIFADGQHKILFNTTRLLNVMQSAGFTTIATHFDNIPWVRFNSTNSKIDVSWQTAAIGIKHPKAEWK